MEGTEAGAAGIGAVGGGRLWTSWGRRFLRLLPL